MTNARSFASLIASSWLLIGCARANPAFGDETEGEASAGDTGERTGSATSSDITGGKTTSGGSATGMNDDGSTSPNMTSTSASTDGGQEEDSSGIGERCPVYSDEHISIDLIAPMGLGPPVTGVCGRQFSTFVGPITVDGDTIRVGACNSCNCPPVDFDFEITTTGGVTIPELPPCGSVMVWEDDVGFGCEWVGLAVLPDEDGPEAPAFIASKSRQLHPSLLAEVGFEIGFGEPDPCKSEIGCLPNPPGGYGLTFGDQPALLMGAEEPRSLPIFGSTEYSVHNHMSWIDPVCQEHIAWEAVRD